MSQATYQTALIDKAVVHGFKLGRLGSARDLREIASVLDRLITVTSMMEDNQHWRHINDVEEHAHIIRTQLLTPWEKFIIEQSKMIPFEKLLGSRDLS